MRYLTLGDQQVSVIGLGLWQFGSKAWGLGNDFGPDDARRIVDRALELGVNLFDTAEVYSSGGSELLLGAALEGRRERAIIASKVGPRHALRRSVRAAAARSIKRLGVETIDLYQVHWPNPIVPLSWTMAGMRDVAESGAVRNVGVSNFSLARWRRADRALGTPVVSNQVRYHLLDRGAERELLPFAQANDRVIIAYSPLAQGLLSGRYTPDDLPGGFRRFSPSFTPANLTRAAPVLDALRQVAGAHGATMAQIALAWVVRHPNVIAIPGAKSVAQAEENAAAADIELTGEEFAALIEASDTFRPVGRMRVAAQVLRRALSR